MAGQRLHCAAAGGHDGADGAFLRPTGRGQLGRRAVLFRLLRQRAVPYLPDGAVRGGGSVLHHIVPGLAPPGCRAASASPASRISGLLPPLRTSSSHLLISPADRIFWSAWFWAFRSCGAPSLEMTDGVSPGWAGVPGIISANWQPFPLFRRAVV